MKKMVIAFSALLVIFAPNVLSARDTSLKGKIQFIKPDHAPGEIYPMPPFTRGEINVPFVIASGQPAKLVFRSLEIGKNGQSKTDFYTMSIRVEGKEDIEVYDHENSLVGIKEVGSVDLAGDGIKDIFWVLV